MTMTMQTRKKKYFRDMKKIKNTLFLMAAIAFVACSDSDIESVAGVSGTSQGEDNPVVIGTMSSVADLIYGPGDEDPESTQSLQSKSQMYYDRVAGVQKTTWVSGDKIGIFSEKDDDAQFAFVVDDENITESGSTSSGIFKPVDEVGAYPIEKTVMYYSYFPYNGSVFKYNEVPVSYAGQVQTANEQMWYYYNRTVGDNAVKFLETEKAAAAHLAPYCFLASNVTSTESAHVHFHYQHLGAMARFYMYVPGSPSDPYTTPAELFIDSIQVVNNSKKFFVEGKMNINSKQLHSPTKESNAISLKFDPAIDAANYSDPDSASYRYWRETKTYKIYSYIMAYMMIAPTDLTDVDNSKLYLLGREPAYYTLDEYNTAKGTSLDATAYDALAKHKKIKIYETKAAYNAAHDPDFDGTDEQYNAKTLGFKLKDATRKFYVATLSKLNFEAGKHYQWNVTEEAADDPITFEEITIQEWEEGAGYNNGGNGTSEW